MTFRRLALAALAIVIVSGTVYEIDETHQAIITQFGEPMGGPITEPGLHYKIPLIQDAHFFERRLLEYDGTPTLVPTRDKVFVHVDTFAKWRIDDPLEFFQRVRDEQGATPRIDEIIDGETRNAISRYDLVELVRSSNREPQGLSELSEQEAAILTPVQLGRRQLAREVLERAAARTADLGIELLDVRFKRINYVPEVQRSVFDRMIAERRRVAELFRSEGEGESARINGERERELRRIQSEAYRMAEETRGVADAEASRVYAAAYGRDPQFFDFMKSLEAYEQTMDREWNLVLGQDSDFLKFFEKPRQ